ncbi:MAG: NUDIX hydrolase [Anaerolineae bacterium]
MKISMLDAKILQAALRGELPGLAAQSKMGIDPGVRRRVPDLSGEPRSSAVLILIFSYNGQLWFPLTQRTYQVAQHKGQISLPGGQREKADANLWETALRETHEEIGIHKEKVIYTGALSSYYVAVSHYIINPFIGWIDNRPTYVTNEEVDAVIEMPLAALLDPAVKSHAARLIDGQQVTVPCYRYQENEIWGATAMILSEFEAVLANIQLK